MLNCFSIRELQSLLKRKFFVDLVNSHTDSIFGDTLIAHRFLMEGNSLPYLHTHLKFKFSPKESVGGTTTLFKFLQNTTNRYDGTHKYVSNELQRIYHGQKNIDLYRVLDASIFKLVYNKISSTDLTTDFLYKLVFSTLQAFAHIESSTNSYFTNVNRYLMRFVPPYIYNYTIEITEFLNFFNYRATSENTKDTMECDLSNSVWFMTSFNSPKHISELYRDNTSVLSESSSYIRYLRHYNPVLRLSPKCGDYIKGRHGDWVRFYPQLVMTIIGKTKIDYTRPI